ncbi:hypothetical protein AVEN_30984-1 [Araneus ventricosus]|uniref:Uncharacterized protein n=1 Tax=Araneus ventricosus TaxID=182803 RepID=A0A4Y2VTT8_ARAVE|nr:hypothetical protein AVEN_30984-1 [Araneus ventricosus]
MKNHRIIKAVLAAPSRHKPMVWIELHPTPAAECTLFCVRGGLWTVLAIRTRTSIILEFGYGGRMQHFETWRSRSSDPRCIGMESNSTLLEDYIKCQISWLTAIEYFWKWYRRFLSNVVICFILKASLPTMFHIALGNPWQ